MKNKNSKYLIIADDFTGANDTGVQLRKKGFATKVVFSSSSIDDNDKCLVFDTETRAIPKKDAYEKLKSDISELVTKYEFDIVYKKVDSALRGNIIDEVLAISEVYNPEVVLFAPALPRLGRTTQNGIQKIYGTRLMETEFVRDPINPIKSDNIVDILKTISRSGVYHINLSELYSKDPVINNDCSYYTFDAQTVKDMELIAKIGLSNIKKILWIGSAGLAEGIFNVLHPQKPSLAIVGSTSQKSIEQLNYAKKQGRYILEIDIPKILESNMYDSICEKAVSILRKNRDLIITSCFSEQSFNEDINYGIERGINKQEIASIVKNILGEITKKILANVEVGGLFLTGGDTAISIMNNLNAQGVEILYEVSPGVIVSRLLNGLYKGLVIMTKAGSFGEEDIIDRCIFKMREVII
ncbi:MULTISPECIES: four-carbon acid sugar kinase family protein [unclassified Treponema]|uniref:four-carbon acid sugar kinase family protein n=1 Tax=unclassified Treponema TaxID=2638727 RepID=UPI0020A45B17|nr:MULTISPECIES: four-carbon acid sugar kinase family protein [unclassified Treponema]UTC68358.1 four-carbon acid sugar kinase family protein [Treponema sp. OMZ 789]UTC71078.1 four-carbon acid sugar kinase family protein [Treponema sp. OMZ 790]UTC73819.1 four-carbon acid sugar kinase family protein [Treponema sp. OMZ 791]